MHKEQLALYFIAGSQDCQKHALERIVEQAIHGGITMFQFREKGKRAKSGADKKALAVRLLALCRAHGVPFIINDDVDLALKIGADGVHVGQDDEAITEVKKRCPKHFIFGVSASSEEEALRARAEGADYIGVGPIAATKTKLDAKIPIGLSKLRAIRQAVGDFPIVAIGGINHKNAAMVRGAGADGISLISAIAKAKNAKAAAEELLTVR